MVEKTSLQHYAPGIKKLKLHALILYKLLQSLILLNISYFLLDMFYLF